jgi:hypothetical protein
MNKTGALKLLATIKLAYPSAYANLSSDYYENVVNLWNDIFSDIDEDVAALALKRYIKKNNPFPPAPGEIYHESKHIQERFRIHHSKIDWIAEDIKPLYIKRKAAEGINIRLDDYGNILQIEEK